MAYQARRQKMCVEDFELVDANGKVVHTLHVHLSPDDTLTKISRKYTALVNAMKLTDGMNLKAGAVEDAQKHYDVLGAAVIDLIEAVFGLDDGKIIIDFYENRYSEMAQEVLPFISTIVLPRLQEIMNEHRKDIRSKYNRKQRRLMGLKKWAY